MVELIRRYLGWDAIMRGSYSDDSTDDVRGGSGDLRRICATILQSSLRTIRLKFGYKMRWF